MELTTQLEDVLRDPAVATLVATALRIHETALAADARLGTVRSALGERWAIDGEGLTLRSLWLVSQRGLRRAGFRRHPTSDVILVAWRGAGMVLLRPPGERRSLELVPFDTAPTAPAVRSVHVPADTPYDTLADMRAWHLLAFHTQPAEGLVRLQQSETGWTETPEETPS